MALSFSTITPGNFDLGPCRVTLGGVDLGGTDKTTLKIEEKLAPIKADQLGDTVIDNRVSGFKMSVETALDEVLLKSNWKAVFRAHKLVTSGPNTSFYFDSQIGQSMVSLAQPLVLHPLDRDNADLSADVNIYLATAIPSSEILQSSSEQKKLKVSFEVYPDFTTTPPRFMLYGDTSIGLVAATGGPAVAATGNTGNGTVGSLVFYSSYTKTETVTLQCLVGGGTGVGKFNVNGSLSGPLGLATVGSSFNAFGSELSFTITGGGTAFVANDSFTISTTAANYA